MSTNDVLMLLEQLNKAKGGVRVDWNIVAPAISAVIMGLIGLWLKRDTMKIPEAVETLKEVKVGVSEVKLDVNSGRTKLEEKLTKVEDKLLVATGEKAASDEKVRSEQDKAVALAATKTAAPEPAPATAHGPARMSKAISELQDAASETIDQSEATTESAEKTEELARKHKP